MFAAGLRFVHVLTHLMRIFGDRMSRWMIGGSCSCSARMPLAVPHNCGGGARVP